MSERYVLKGNLLYSTSPEQMVSVPNGFLVCQEGKVAGAFPALPECYKNLPLVDYGDRLIIPGLVDLHLHAPQYAFRGIGMDMELLDWLETHVFPEEAKYKDLEYARKAYSIFASDLAASATTRACIFATIHRPATLLLMELLEETRGVKALVGKVNMDRNSPAFLCEESAQRSLEETALWIEQGRGRFQNVGMVLTPRFTPSCTDPLMKGLGRLQKETGLPVQSHLSENLSEIEWVRELCPGASSYGETYYQAGLLGGEGCPTIMAHCVHSSEQEMALLKKQGVYLALCAQSNTNLRSGIAPVRAYMEQGMNLGLGTDVAGGSSLSIFHAMVDAMQSSNLRWRLVDDSWKPLTVKEAFYLGTKGGGSFFGKVGSFEEGYAFDAVVLDDTGLPHPQPLTPEERLERMLYLSDDRQIYAKYLEGYQVFQKGNRTDALPQQN